MSKKNLTIAHTVSGIVTTGFVRRHCERFHKVLLLILVRYVDIMALPVLLQDNNVKIQERIDTKNSIDIQIVSESKKAYCVVGPINRMISEAIDTNIKLRIPMQYWNTCQLLILLVGFVDDLKGTVIPDIMKGHLRVLAEEEYIRILKFKVSEGGKSIVHRDIWKKIMTRESIKVKDNINAGTISLDLIETPDHFIILKYGASHWWKKISMYMQDIYVLIKHGGCQVADSKQVYSLSIAHDASDQRLFSCKDI